MIIMGESMSFIGLGNPKYPGRVMLFWVKSGVEFLRVKSFMVVEEINLG